MPLLLKLRTKFEGVPGGFKMFCKETSKWLPPDGPANDWWSYEQAVRKHYQANNIPIGLLFSEQIEHEACLNTTDSKCVGDISAAKKLPFLNIDSAAVMRALKTMLSWVWSGEKVSHDETDKRAEICIKCPHNLTGGFCTTCKAGEFIGLISGFIGAYKSKHDTKLGVCKVCAGCSLKVKGRIPLSAIHAHEDPAMQEFYPDFCWIKKPTANEPPNI